MQSEVQRTGRVQSGDVSRHYRAFGRPGKTPLLIAHGMSCGVNVIGPVPLGGRFWSAYFYDPNGIRLEIATSRAPAHLGVVPSALQTEQEARAELETLFNDPKAVNQWLAKMPLKNPQMEEIAK